MKRIAYMAALLIPLFSSCAGSSDDPGATSRPGVVDDRPLTHPYDGVTERRFSMYRHELEGGGYVDYLIKVPADYESQPGREWPLVLHLHAMGGGDQVEYLCGLFDMFWDIRRDLDGTDDAFILIPRYFTNDNASELLMDVIASYRVDERRLYLTGMSMGGSGSFNVANHLYNGHGVSFAAISRCSGNNLDPDINYEGLARNVIWMHVGAEDGTRDGSGQGPVNRSDESYANLKTALQPHGAVETKSLHVSPMAATQLGSGGSYDVDGETYDSYTVCLQDRTDWNTGNVVPLYAQVRDLTVAGKLRVRQSVYYYGCQHDAFAPRVENYLAWLFSQRRED